MAATKTPNYGWTQPAVGGDASVWGTEINNDLALIDAQVYANEQATVMVGCITMYGGATPPANWLLCNGASLATTGTYAALFAILGYAFGGSGANFNLPNLQQTFPLGAGSTNALGSTGGEATHVLSAAELAAHSHPITQVAHTHTASAPAHTHTDAGHGHAASGSQDAHNHTFSMPGSGVNFQAGSGFTSTGNTGTTSTAQPNVYVSVGTGAANIQAAQPAITVNATTPTGPTATGNSGGGAAHNNMPPFVAINYIIRFQ